MEKYRKYSDAATGVNPFLSQRVPSTLGRLLTPLMFPIRLLFLLCFTLLLFLVESVFVYGLCYQGLGRLCGCMAAAEAVYTYSGLGLLREGLLLRGFFFFLGHVLPVTIDPMARSLQNHSNSSNAPPKASIRGGDLVVCNMQSVWDFMVLEVVLRKPFLAVAFPAPPAAFFSSSAAAASTEDRKDEPLSTLVLFPPGVCQRYRVWRHLYRTNSYPYLEALAKWQREVLDSAASTHDKNHQKAYIDVALEGQCQARALGVPLVYFAEGTATNGRGVLQLPRLRCFSNRAAANTNNNNNNSTNSAEPVLRVHTATLFYQSDALITVCTEQEGAHHQASSTHKGASAPPSRQVSIWRVLYNASVLLYGGNSGGGGGGGSGSGGGQLQQQHLRPPAFFPAVEVVVCLNVPLRLATSSNNKTNNTNIFSLTVEEEKRRARWYPSATAADGTALWEVGGPTAAGAQLQRALCCQMQYHIQSQSYQDPNQNSTNAMTYIQCSKEMQNFKRMSVFQLKWKEKSEFVAAFSGA